jgi:hypothetical protein
MKTLLLLLCTLALTACSSLSVDLPVSRFELPETNGLESKRLQVSLQAEPSHNYEMVPDASARPPSFARPVIDQETSVGAHGSYTVADRFDLSLKTSLGRSPWMFYGKYQILGDSLDAAAMGNVSLAVTGGVGYGHSSNSGDQRGTFGPGGYNWEGEMTTFVTDAALIAGYRTADRVLLYTSAFYSNYSFNGKVNQSRSDDGTSAGGEYTNAAAGYQRGANAGIAVNFGTSGIFKIEGVYSDLATSRKDNWILSYGASIGGRF